MLSIRGRRVATCEGLSRRDLLTAGGTGLLGLSLPKLLAAEAGQPLRRGRAKSVIFLFLFGGPSQLETFDLKPEAPREIRGPFLPIASRTPGLLISEHLPNLAAVSDKHCVVRTMTHAYNNHSGGAHYIQTGRRWQVPSGAGHNATPEDWPAMGSVVEYLTQHAPGGLDRAMPNYAVVPNSLGRIQMQGPYQRPGEYAGWLGRAYNPMTTRIDRRDKTDNPYWRDCTDEELNFQLEGLAPNVSLDAMRRRAALLEQFEAQRREITAADALAYDRFRRRCMALVTSETTRAALDIRREKPRLRERYGRHLFGQSCLMARRMVEAGVRFVTVHYDCVDGYSWDSHRNSDDVKNHLLPTFDQACSALLTDLDERGLLDETLVVAMGEMGRTPKATGTWGRGHWSTLFPALLAGAGVAGGTTFGRSDRHAARPADEPVSPEDLSATIYQALGIDPRLTLPDKLGRPIPINDSGRPLRAVLG